MYINNNSVKIKLLKINKILPKVKIYLVLLQLIIYL